LNLRGTPPAFRHKQQDPTKQNYRDQAASRADFRRVDYVATSVGFTNLAFVDFWFCVNWR
jgi:hypothetical protein